jgi:hypothetical protein
MSREDIHRDARGRWIVDIDTTVKPLHGHQQGTGRVRTSRFLRVAG